MPETLKLTFDDREPFQVVMDAVSRQHGGIAIERETGVTLHVRGNEVTIEGDETARAFVGRLLRQMYGLARAGKPIHGSDVVRAIEVLRRDPNADLQEVFDDVVVQRADGKGVAPRSLAQQHYVHCIRNYSLTFGIGPAGTGKTFLAVAAAVRMLVDKHVRRIVISRPAIEAGENLGFLPGTLEQKISPYLRPLYDALYEMLDPAKVMRMIEQGALEIAPLAYMRGRTLNHAFVILDEAQNTTREQMKMFLTRMGEGSKVVVTGDPTQVDLPGSRFSGLAHALRVLQGVEGIAVCRLSDRDVMRHPLVQSIVRAYDRDAERRQQARANGAGAERGPGGESGE